MSSVFCIEAEGITRAWPTVPLTSTKMRMTQNQAMASRVTFCWVVRFSSDFFCLSGLAGLVFMRHRDWAVGLYGSGTFHAGLFQKLPVRAALANFELHEVGRINARITRRTKRALGIADGLFQSGERNVAERIGAEEFADFRGRAAGRDEFFARGRVHAVVAGGNCRRAGDANVDCRCAGFAYHAHDFA